VLVAAELSICLVLLIGAGLLGRSFLKFASIELGFKPERLLTFRVNLSDPRYATAEGQVRFYQDALERMKRLPMVREAAVATDLPLSGERQFQSTSFQVAGHAPLPLAQRPAADITVVSRDYFRTLAIPMKSGRTFGAEDNASSSDKIVVNEAFARIIFPGENPVGRRILSGREGGTEWTIVGVAGSIRGSELGAEPAPLIYRCDCQGGNRFLTRMRFLVRTAGDPQSAVRVVEQQVYAVDRDQPVYEVATMEQRLENSLAPRRFQLALIGGFALAAVLLAAAGVYGVVSFQMARRARELAIRVAMGARPRDITRLVLGESLALFAAATAAGLGAAWCLTRFVRSMLYGVTAQDPAAFGVAPLVLLAAVLCASIGPARRASLADPIAVLREQ
jgi:putative ABC transport system permease protein